MGKSKVDYRKLISENLDKGPKSIVTKGSILNDPELFPDSAHNSVCNKVYYETPDADCSCSKCKDHADLPLRGEGNQR